MSHSPESVVYQFKVVLLSISPMIWRRLNQVISKRMVKKQQMRWSRQAAHLLLQIRTKVLDEELPNTFHRWYSGFDLSNENLKQAA